MSTYCPSSEEDNHVPTKGNEWRHSQHAAAAVLAGAVSEFSALSSSSVGRESGRGV